MTTGQIPVRANIASVSKAERCVVQTEEENAFATGDFVRITDLDGCMPVPRGMDQLNNGIYLIEIIDVSSFFLKDPETKEYINSVDYTSYVLGGRCNLDHHDFNYLP